MKKIAFVAAFGLAFAGIAQAQDEQDASGETSAQATATEQQQAEEEEEEAEDPRMQEVQCRTERVTGSRTRVNRTCLTRAEWQEIERRTRREVGRMQGNAAGGAACMPDGQGGCS